MQVHMKKILLMQAINEYKTHAAKEWNGGQSRSRLKDS